MKEIKREIKKESDTVQKIRRFKMVAPFQYELIEEDLTTYGDWDQSVADDSYFIPNSQSVARLAGGKPYSSDEVKMAYDFPDGKDTGLKVANRKKGRDMAEISTEIRLSQQEIKDGFETFKRDYEREVRREMAFQNAKSQHGE